MKKIIFKLVSI